MTVRGWYARQDRGTAGHLRAPRVARAPRAPPPGPRRPARGRAIVARPRGAAAAPSTRRARVEAASTLRAGGRRGSAPRTSATPAGRLAKSAGSGGGGAGFRRRRALLQARPGRAARAAAGGAAAAAAAARLPAALARDGAAVRDAWRFARDWAALTSRQRADLFHVCARPPLAAAVAAVHVARARAAGSSFRRYTPRDELLGLAAGPGATCAVRLRHREALGLPPIVQAVRPGAAKCLACPAYYACAPRAPGAYEGALAELLRRGGGAAAPRPRVDRQNWYAFRSSAAVRKMLTLPEPHLGMRL